MCPLAHSLSSRTSIRVNSSPASSRSLTSTTVHSRTRDLASATSFRNAGACCLAIAEAPAGCQTGTTLTVRPIVGRVTTRTRPGSPAARHHGRHAVPIKEGRLHPRGAPPMPRLFVPDYTRAGWSDPDQADDLAARYCEHLEAGEILFFPDCPFDFPEESRQALLAHRQSGLKYHKNVSYQPRTGAARGMSADDQQAVDELRGVLRTYSNAVVKFVDDFLAPYLGHYKLDFASYRPVEEEGRPMSLHKRNDLLHVDAFPNRPTAGGRILPGVANLNPTKTRDWIVTDGFDRLAERYADEAGLKRFARQARSPVSRFLRRVATAPFRLAGKLKGMPTAYDRFMQRFHNFLKENDAFQRDC